MSGTTWCWLVVATLAGCGGRGSETPTEDTDDPDVEVDTASASDTTPDTGADTGAGTAGGYRCYGTGGYDVGFDGTVEDQWFVGTEDAPPYRELYRSERYVDGSYESLDQVFTTRDAAGEVTAVDFVTGWTYQSYAGAFRHHVEYGAPGQESYLFLDDGDDGVYELEEVYTWTDGRLVEAYATSVFGPYVDHTRTTWVYDATLALIRVDVDYGDDGTIDYQIDVLHPDGITTVEAVDSDGDGVYDVLDSYTRIYELDGVTLFSELRELQDDVTTPEPEYVELKLYTDGRVTARRAEGSGNLEEDVWTYDRWGRELTHVRMANPVGTDAVSFDASSLTWICD